MVTPVALRPPRPWTALLYLDGNNQDIESDVFHSFLGAEELADRPELNLVAELGRRPKPSSLPSTGGMPPRPGDMDDRWESVRRYEIQKGPPERWPRRVSTGTVEHDGKIDSKLVQDHGPVDMSDPARLEDFLTWGIKSYPAEHYMVVLADHGAGFLGTLSDETARRHMPVREVEAVMDRVEAKTGVRPELLVMDACLMAQAEVAGQLQDNATFYVASEEINWNSYPLQKTLKEAAKAWDAGRTVGPEEMGRLLVDECGKAGHTFPTASMLDLRRMPECTAAVKGLAERLLATDTDPGVVRDVIARTPGFGAGETSVKPYSDYKDLGAFARNLAQDPRLTDAPLKAAAAEVLRVLQDRLVTAEAHKERREGELEGLSVYLPTTGFQYDVFGWQFPFHTDKREYEATYRSLDFVRETGWDKVIDRFAGPAEPPKRTPSPW